MKKLIAGTAFGLIALTPQLATAQDATCQQGTCISTWKNASSTNQTPVFAFGQDYKAFLAVARTELSTVTELTRQAKAAGFKPWKAGTRVKAGARYYHVNRGRAMVLIIGGETPVAKGVRIVASHIDSPRLELKGRPVDSKEGFALFQTNTHGSIKTYQWTNVPLAIMGRVDRKDGTTVAVSLGLNPRDPIFMIPDLSPHTAKTQMKKSARNVISHEDLDPIVASGPHGAHSATTWLLGHLKTTYNIDPADLVSAELALVPAMPPRDMGFDRRLTAAYGQDDRLSAFASAQAAFELKTPPQTTVIHFADNEETGNVNVSGASSTYLTDLLGEILYAEIGSKYRQPLLTRALRASKALSIDVNPAINPLNPNAWEKTNAPRLGYGINIKLYGRGFDANSEFIAWVRGALDAKKIPWQTTTYKVGRAGGSTLGRELSRYNIDTIDFGVPVLSIHTPYAVSDKSDVFALKHAVLAFIQRTQ
ncbi:MAG: aminopeptidase 1 [Kordiimonadaceae bacterium]|nr:aminopeptidase 1 [Kordiimonadaceae bacterium]